MLPSSPMILTIDIGNSFTKFGLWEGTRLDERFSCATSALSEPDSLTGILEGLSGKGIDTVCACSVVPSAKTLMSEALTSTLGLTSKWIDGTSNLGMPIAYETPLTLGADRVAAAFGALKRYGAPAIVCDFGTAMTIDVVRADGSYAGGMIAPGIGMVTGALGSKAAQLFEVDVAIPESVIGSSTGSALRSGVFHTVVGTLETAVDRIGRELGERPRVIATGGDARVIAKGTAVIDIVDDDLVLYGLFMASAVI